MLRLPMWAADPDALGASPQSGGSVVSPADLPLPAGSSGSDSGLAEPAANSSEVNGGELARELSTELVLEIVLSLIAEQARVATDATGAAIVLEREGTLICRATAGLHAPGLGETLDLDQGLSGTCFQTGQIERSDDIQSDPRAKVETDRLPDVRSVTILPLLQNDAVIGVFEVFSSRPFAFGEQEERTLKMLAQQVLKSLRQASEPASVEDEPGAAAETDRLENLETPTRDEEDLTATALGSSSRVPRANDIKNLVLAGAVFASIVLLSVLIGFHWGRNQSVARYRHQAQTAKTAPGIPQNTDLPDASSSLPAQAAGISAGGDIPIKPAKARPSSTRARARREAAPIGSLLVYRKGREVFRMLPSAEIAKMPNDKN